MWTQFEIAKHSLRPVAAELVKVTAGPGEAAASCMVLFIHLWQLHKPESSLDDIAEAARLMVLSYDENPRQPC